MAKDHKPKNDKSNMKPKKMKHDDAKQDMDMLKSKVKGKCIK